MEPYLCHEWVIRRQCECGLYENMYYRFPFQLFCSDDAMISVCCILTRAPPPQHTNHPFWATLLTCRFILYFCSTTNLAMDIVVLSVGFCIAIHHHQCRVGCGVVVLAGEGRIDDGCSSFGWGIKDISIRSYLYETHKHIEQWRNKIIFIKIHFISAKEIEGICIVLFLNRQIAFYF